MQDSSHWLLSLGGVSGKAKGFYHEKSHIGKYHEGLWRYLPWPAGEASGRGSFDHNRQPQSGKRRPFCAGCGRACGCSPFYSAGNGSRCTCNLIRACSGRCGVSLHSGRIFSSGSEGYRGILSGAAEYSSSRNYGKRGKNQYKRGYCFCAEGEIPHPQNTGKFQQ